MSPDDAVMDDVESAPEPGITRATGGASPARLAIATVYARVQWMPGHVIQILTLLLRAKRYHTKLEHSGDTEGGVAWRRLLDEN